MTRNEKAVCLFGVEMNAFRWQDGSTAYALGGCLIREFHDGWSGIDERGDGNWTRKKKTRHAAARALERKIVAAHKRLGKLIGGKS